MNCANHADASAVAYCRTCGKPLCANCTRPVRGVIYCEDCLGAKMEGTVPPPPAAGFVPGNPTPGFVPGAAATGRAPAPSSGSGPNPTVAGILGAIPFGIGAVYNGQYGKGLAHLAIFAFLIYGSGHSGPWGDTFFGIAIAFFVFYQIFDAVRTAKAIQAGAPGPDPFGLAEMTTGGNKIDSSRIPMGAIVLILLGVVFLLHTMGMEFGLERFWPLILIGLGGWLLARNAGLLASGCRGCQCARCRTRRIMGPSVLLTVGVLFLLENLQVANFGRTWPVILLVVGVIKLLQGSSSIEGHMRPPGPSEFPASGPTAPPPPPPSPVVPTGEVNRG